MKRLIQRVAALTAALCVAAACVAPVYAETANTEKEENVYVSLAGDGSVADIYIVNMFALDGKTEIRDYGAYSSVRNLTSEADISLDGDSVTVSAEAGTFYYQANLKDAQLPWNISVAYMLDGKNVAADELAGANGHLVISGSVTKNKLADGDFYEAYMVQATVLLDTVKCRNIQTEGATEANVGADKQLSYMKLPIAVQSGCDMILYYRDHDEDLRFMREGLESGQLTQERLDEAVLRVLAFKAMLRLHEKQRTNALMPAEEGLSVIGCPEHRAAAARIIDRSITLVKNSRAQLPITPQAHKRAILYSVSSVSLAARVLGKADKVREYLAQELEKQGFSVEVYRLNPFKYLTPKGINGKKVLADIPVLEFRKKYDVVFVIADVQSFSTTNERNLHWSIPMGPEIPWYAAEKPTVFISVANPFHLYDVPMVPVCINTYNGSREAIRQAVEKITGKSEFKGNSPVDAFCGMWDTRL